ncbi:Rap1a/Tai family immunity protein [Phenylobacterium montanum]|uniref:Rap1a immunity protein domain-containing protein n=1 Tax=Phenylobacterium montanum TaxID=2823693 RepID=A0A975IVT9_9CAUL|nr:Rap1a/Tai family immunity protein [Caulobacter sp. S6]QUD88904.1 hypothetical protein KCG34_03165 [Caulobacter sp. S6]
MQRAKLIATIAAFAALVGSPSSANETSGLSGKDLWTYCDTPEQSANHSLRIGYIGGSINALHMLRSTLRIPIYCPPNNINNPQEVEIAISYIKDNPTKRQYSAASLILGSLNEAFPCNEKSSPSK